jgi:Sec-independent protein translocase protein TatA
VESFFGIGGPELLLILALATIILGPLRMIRAARTMGRLARDLRNYYTELTRGLNEELAALSELEESVRGEVTAAIPSQEELQILPPTQVTETTPSEPEATSSVQADSSPGVVEDPSI